MRSVRIRARSQRGIYIVLSLSIVATLLLLAVLVIGLGYRSGDRVLLRNHANLIALGGMEGFVTAPGNPTYSQKANAGLARANYLLNRNTLKGIVDPTAGNEQTGIGCLSHVDGSGACPAQGFAGTLTYGRWYERMPANDPCATGDATLYPCFRSNPAPVAADPRETANAARVVLRNKTGNPITAPIVGELGYIEEHSYAIMVPRCMASIVDLSYSAVSETHEACSSPQLGCYCARGESNCPATTSSPPFYPLYPSPPVSGLFVFPKANIPDSSATPPTTCANLNPFIDFPSFEKLIASIYWCNMPAVRNTDDPSVHFRSDYEEESRPAPLGPILVDKYRRPASGHLGPQPFTRFLSAINAALRLIRATFTLGDRSVLMGFNGRVVAKVPGIQSDGTSESKVLTDEMDYLIQITNPDNIGSLVWNGSTYTRTNPVYPNYLNAGFYPLFSQDEVKAATNLIGAIYEASAAIADNTACDEIARRSILLATDGLANCAPQTTPVNEATAYVCKSGDWSIYQQQEQVLTDEIRRRLLDNKISLTVLVDGDMVDPHYLDILNAAISPDNGTDYLTIEEARQEGHGIDPSKPPLFNVLPSCPLGVSPCNDQVAFDHLGETDYVFRRPLAALGRVALETGGLICPLLNRCNVPAVDCPACLNTETGRCYKPDPKGGPYEILRDCARSDGSIQRCSPIDASKSEQAALCATKAVGGNPFALREPVTVR